MKHLLFAIIACVALLLAIEANVVKASDCYLVKSESNPAVYYTCDSSRYVFPTEGVYFSWYKDFEFVQKVTDTAITNYQFAGNVTYRPGVKLVKIQTNPKVYAVEGKKLRWVTSESLAKELYGFDWAKKVDDISDTYFVNYVMGEPIYKKTDFDPISVKDSYPWISNILDVRESKSFCGNGKVEIGEECDGGWYCNQFCKIVSVYSKVFDNPVGSIEDIYVKVGDKVPVDGGMNLRIESLNENANPELGSRLGFSIWGKDFYDTCKLISTTGDLWSNVSSQSYRALAGAFFELVSVSDDKAHVRKYTGLQARSRCLKISGNEAGGVCNYYPAGDSYYVEGKYFKVHFSSTENQNAAEYYVRAFDNCYSLYAKELEGIVLLKSFRNDRKWDIYPTDIDGFTTDFERVMVPRLLMKSQKKLSQLESTKNGRCPIEDAGIAHELGHLLFANTVLQGMYDVSAKAEIQNSNEIGSVSLSEGLPTFLVSYISRNKDNEEARNYTSARDGYCGQNRLINTDGKFAGASYNQLSYSEALAGRGIAQSDYYAGYCFFRRVEDECIANTNFNLFAQVVMNDGSINIHPTVFTMLAARCGKDIIESIMTDFGFNHNLLEITQKFPNNGFVSGLDDLGCK